MGTPEGNFKPYEKDHDANILVQVKTLIKTKGLRQPIKDHAAASKAKEKAASKSFMDNMKKAESKAKQKEMDHKVKEAVAQEKAAISDMMDQRVGAKPSAAVPAAA